MDPRFIFRYQSAQKSLLLRFKRFRLAFHNLARSLFWASVSKRVTHLADRFFIPNSSVTMLCTRFFEIPTPTGICCSRKRRSLSNILCTFSTFDQVAICGRPLRESFSKLSLLRLNSFAHLLTAISEGVESPNVSKKSL
jgi:hypothetical protein